MKNTVFILLFAIGLPQISTAQVTAYSVGDNVDSIGVTDMNATFHDLYHIALSGKYILVDVFDVDGPSSQNSFEAFNQLYEKYGCNGGDIYCIAVNNGSDPDGTVTDFINNYGGTSAQAPVVTGSEGTKLKDYFGISAYPTFFLIGSDNNLKNDDIWPVSSVEDLESGFPFGFEPTAMSCAAEIDHQKDLLMSPPYPNPVKNKLNIELNIHPNDNVQLSLFNNLGQEMKSVSVNNQTLIQLGLEDVPAGIYHLNLTSEQQSATFRIEVID